MAAKRMAEVSRLQSRWRSFSFGFVARMVILSLLWCWLTYICFEVKEVMATSALYTNFEPYAILEVSSRTSTADIKKAFRKLSLKYHPDKYKEADAGERFMLIKKAYDALTDPIAKRNYALYGNPDGPSTIKLSVAVPKISKENQGIVLVLFLVFFILGVPFMTGSEAKSTDLSGSAMEALEAGISPGTSLRSLQELVLRVCAKPGLGEEDAIAALREALRSDGASLTAASSGKKGPKSGAAAEDVVDPRA
ncbi:unnamed protein product [Polarella glacialis]|uniref:J domain-containing protein n=1 Tax=Polarella glacialis TaxID=89957 RepID=A0A813JTN0_POLGL|nr:unnamed protein product [Polarella glacialis]CAE8684291.1 unnamed protein product [Polarella glacialis]